MQTGNRACGGEQFIKLERRFVLLEAGSQSRGGWAFGGHSRKPVLFCIIKPSTCCLSASCDLSTTKSHETPVYCCLGDISAFPVSHAQHCVADMLCWLRALNMGQMNLGPRSMTQNPKPVVQVHIETSITTRAIRLGQPNYVVAG
jgi:hypothetical protein